MNLYHLRVFQTVAEHEHITRASEELILSQPAVTKIIQSLEHETGLELIERHGRRIVLTHAVMCCITMLVVCLHLNVKWKRPWLYYGMLKQAKSNSLQIRQQVFTYFLQLCRVIAISTLELHFTLPS